MIKNKLKDIQRGGKKEIILLITTNFYILITNIIQFFLKHKKNYIFKIVIPSDENKKGHRYLIPQSDEMCQTPIYD